LGGDSGIPGILHRFECVAAMSSMKFLKSPGIMLASVLFALLIVGIKQLGF
jgi:hypothetical protein